MSEQAKAWAIVSPDRVIYGQFSRHKESDYGSVVSDTNASKFGKIGSVIFHDRDACVAALAKKREAKAKSLRAKIRQLADIPADDVVPKEVE